MNGPPTTIRIRIMRSSFHENEEAEPVQPVQMNIYLTVLPIEKT